MSGFTAWILACALALWIAAILWETDFPKGLRPWLKKPPNEALALQIAVGTVAILFAIAAWFSDRNTWLGSFQTEATGIAVTVILIEFVTHRRAHLERKHAIIQQMASLSNAFAIEAARIARAERWTHDRSLNGGYFASAALQGADLRGAKFQNADLRDADLRKANLFLADFENADLRIAKLQDAHIHVASFENADLRGANLLTPHIHTAYLRGAKYDETTVWPPGFDPQRLGAIKVKPGKY